MKFVATISTFMISFSHSVSAEQSTHDNDKPVRIPGIVGTAVLTGLGTVAGVIITLREWEGYHLVSRLTKADGSPGNLITYHYPPTPPILIVGKIFTFSLSSAILGYFVFLAGKDPIPY